MKKLLILVSLALSINLVYAQKSAISVGYGFGSSDQIVYGFALGFSSAFGSVFGSDKTFEGGSYIGPIALSYHRTLANNERFWYGGSAIFEASKFYEKGTKDEYSYNAITLT